MALFRRADRTGTRIAAFWDWWAATGRAAAGRSIAGELEPRVFADELTSRLSPLGDLDWELTRGETSEHVLVITAGADAGLRSIARRIVLASPAADETWSYVDARPPVPEPETVVLGAEGAEQIDFARITVGARLDGNRFDVQVHHPAFPDLPADARKQVTVLALDSALGEVDTELWIGDIASAEVPPLDGFGLSALRSVVHDLKAKHLDADGHPTWALLQGETSNGPLFAAAQVPLHPLTAPLLDTYVAVVVPYSGRNDLGLPGEGSLEALRALEDRLGTELGSQGKVVAHQSVAGVRTLHLYVEGRADVVPAVRTLARTWDQGPVSVHDMLDPGWDSVRHLRA